MATVQGQCLGRILGSWGCNSLFLDLAAGYISVLTCEKRAARPVCKQALFCISPRRTEAAFKNGTVVLWNGVVRHGIWRWLSPLLSLFYLLAFDLGKALLGFLPTAVVRIGSQNHRDDEVTDCVPKPGLHHLHQPHEPRSLVPTSEMRKQAERLRDLSGGPSEVTVRLRPSPEGA